MVSLSHPFKEDHFYVPLSSRWSMVWCPWLCAPEHQRLGFVGLWLWHPNPCAAISYTYSELCCTFLGQLTVNLYSPLLVCIVSCSLHYMSVLWLAGNQPCIYVTTKEMAKNVEDEILSYSCISACWAVHADGDSRHSCIIIWRGRLSPECCKNGF